METTLQVDSRKTSEEKVLSESSMQEITPGIQSSPHAQTIAQLESWLRSIERERKDRSAGDPRPSSSQ
jgi:hypothetical protein